MKPRHRRLLLIVAGVAVLGVAAALVLRAFQSNLVFFFSPSQIAAHEAPLDRTFRVGGMVENGSLTRLPDGLTVQFIITDTAKTIPVAKAQKGELPVPYHGPMNSAGSAGEARK
jgi:cytochrome c-type biogenesis protein CcmE